MESSGTKLTNLNIRVFQKLNGEDSDVVTDKLFRKYLSEVVFSDFELPLHYQLRLDDFVREVVRNNDIGVLLEYFSEALGCCAFSLGKKSVKLRGLRYLETHDEVGKVLNFLEDPKKIWDFIENNFSLYPTLVTNHINISSSRLNNVAFIYKEFGNRRIGLVGLFPMDFKLAVSFFEFLRFHV